MNTPKSADHLLKALDQCVVCGLCIPHCPTYPLTQREGDSPRGRIALMQGLVSGRLTDADHANEAIARCLGCRACETVCPAQVPYGAALAEFKLIGPSDSRQAPLVARLSRRIAGNAGLMSLVSAAARAFLAVPSSQTNPGKLSRLARYAAGSRRQTSKKAPKLQAEGSRGQVILFPGCVAPGVAPNQSASAGQVLNHLGFGVILPKRTTCCGALSLADGNEAELRTHMARMAELASAGAKELPLVSLASGCSSQASLYAALPQLSETGTDWTRRFVDIMVFLESALEQAQPAFAKGHMRVAIHEPCSIKHGLRQPGLTRRVLSAIPGLELRTLPSSVPCCGAAGSNMFSQPQIADALAKITVDALLESEADIVVSANIGCALHIQSELLRRGSPIQVAHPVELLAAHLPG